MLAGGLAMLGFFAILPMYQVSQRVPDIRIWFKGILLGSILTTISVANLVFGTVAFAGRKQKRSR